MRLKKALLFTTLIPSLVACNTSSIAGTYGFQLGKESSTHFGVYLKLTDKAYVPTDEQDLGDEKFKQFNMTVTANGLKENVVNQCIHMKVSGSSFIFMVLYVDDILLASNDTDLLFETK